MARSLVFEFSAKAGNFVSVTDKMSSKLNTIANTANAFANTTRTAFAGIARASTGMYSAFQGTVGSFAKFDELNREVAATTGMTAGQMQNFAKQIGQLGVKTIFTTEELQRAAGEAAKMGATKDEVIPLVAAIADVAAVTKTDLVKSIGTAKSVMAQFNLQAGDLGRLAPLMIQMATGSAASVGDLSAAFVKAGPPAKLFGNEVQDVVPVLQVFRDQGIKGEQAGNAIASMFKSLSAPTKKASKALVELGLANAKTGAIADVVNPKLSKLPTIIGALSKIDPTQANAIFGAEFGPLIAGLARFQKGSKNAADTIGSYRKSLLDAGAAAAKAKTINSGMSYEIKQIEASFELAKTKIGELISTSTGLGGIFEDARKSIGGVVETLNSIDPEKFRDITVRVFQPASLGKIFDTAVNSLLPAFLKVIPPAFFFGVRQMVTFMPLVAKAFAKGSIDLLGTALVTVSKAAGLAYANVVMAQMSFATDKIAQVFASVVGVFSSDLASKITGASASFQSGLEGFRQGWTDSIKKGAGDLGKILKEATSFLNVNTKQDLKGGRALADILGFDAGALARVMNNLKDAGDVTAKAFGKLAAQAEADRKAEVAAREAKRQSLLKQMATLKGEGSALLAQRPGLLDRQAKLKGRLAKEEAEAEKARGLFVDVRSLPGLRKSAPEFVGAALQRIEAAGGTGGRTVAQLEAAYSREQSEAGAVRKELREVAAALRELPARLAANERAITQIQTNISTNYGVKSPEAVGRSRTRAQTAGGISSAGEAR